MKALGDFINACNGTEQHKVHESKPPSSLKGKIGTELWLIHIFVNGKGIRAAAHTYICNWQGN